MLNFVYIYRTGLSNSSSKGINLQFLFLLSLSFLLWGCTAVSPQETVLSASNVGLATAVPDIPTPLPPVIVVESAPTLIPTLPVTAVPTPTAQPTATPTATPIVPVWSNPLDETYATEAALWGGEFALSEPQNTGIWQYAPRTFLHPIAIKTDGNHLFLLDGGRILYLDLRQPLPPEILLQAGDVVDGVVVQEIMDLALISGSLLALDRASDVYRYDFAQSAWSLERFERPAGLASSRYFIELDATENGRYLLDTNYQYVMQYQPDGGEYAFTLPDTARGISMSAIGDDVYVLTQRMDNGTVEARRYNFFAESRYFRPKMLFEQARQILATDTAVYILDKEGRRLWELDAVNGRLQTLTQLPQTDPATTMTLNPQTGELILAGQERLYFLNDTTRFAGINGGPQLEGPQPHDPQLLASVQPKLIPIAGSGITSRDLQLPGAPRHYRLGIHEGIDFYWQPGTPIRAVADGTVIRAIQDFVPLDRQTYIQLQAETEALTYTSPETLDLYRGRQVWVQHADGTIARYLHMRVISPEVVVGSTVTQGQILGEIGNSGSPVSPDSDTEDAHLQFELWVEGSYLGQFLRPIEVREMVERIFGQK